MTAGKFLSELHDSEPLLSTVGWLQLVAFFASLAAMPFDSTLVGGVNPWLKPMKFAIPIMVYLWTLGWLLRYLRNPRWLVQSIRGGVSLLMLTLMFCVWLQAARGTSSHFNTDTVFDAAVFGVMGLALVLNTLLIIAVLALFFWDYSDLAPAYLWGIRLGLFGFFLAGLTGLIMAQNMGHAVGVPDGGPGLPLLNWSTEGGDLRIPHIFGLHALQILPFAGYWISRRTTLPLRSQTVATFVFGIAYITAGFYLLNTALAGKPL